MNKEEAIEHLRSLVTEPDNLSPEEYLDRTTILMPRLLNKSAYSTEYKTSKSSCFDICSSNYHVIESGQRRAVGTALFLTYENAVHRVQLNPKIMNLALVLRPRSGLALKGIDLGAGEIDCDYTIENSPNNEIKVVLINNSSDAFVINPGDRIAQAKWELVLRDPFLPVKEEKRTGGFGSTGQN